MDRLIRIFGERHTATRALIRIVETTPGIALARRAGRGNEPTSLNGVDEDFIKESLRQPWSRVYREALKDYIDKQRGPLSTWKHGVPVYDNIYKERNVSTMFSVRHPYSWALAMHRRPHHSFGSRKNTLAEFVEHVWMSTDRDLTEKFLPSPMDLWNLKLKGFREFEKEALDNGVPTALIRFEDFVVDPVETFSTTLLKCRIEGITPVHDSSSTKRFGKSGEERRNYYKNELWQSDLDPESVAIMNDRVDWDLAQACGYEKMSPDQFSKKDTLEQPTKFSLASLWKKSGST